jgi:hypothetical protein
MIAIRENQVSRCRVYEPTPKDIRRACDEIQARWSPRQRAKRTQTPLATWWTVPMIRMSEIVEALHGEQADCSPFRSEAGCES